MQHTSQSVYSFTSAGPHGGVYVASDLTLEYDLQQLLYRQQFINQRQREAAGYPPSDSLLFSGNPTTSSFPQSQPLVLYAWGQVTFAALQAVRSGALALSDIIPRDRPDILSGDGWRQLESLCLELVAAAQLYYGAYSQHTRELYHLADELRATAAYVDSIYLRTPRASDYAQLPQLPLEALLDPLYYHPAFYEEQREQSDFDAWVRVPRW